MEFMRLVAPNFQKFVPIIIIIMCVWCVCEYTESQVYGITSAWRGQRRTFRNQFSPSVMGSMDKTQATRLVWQWTLPLSYFPISKNKKQNKTLIYVLNAVTSAASESLSHSSDIWTTLGLTS